MRTKQNQQLTAAKALARQLREVVIPEVDAYTYKTMATKAGNKPDAVALTAENIYTEILKASKALDDEEVPETDDSLLSARKCTSFMKRCKDITMETEIGNDLGSAA